MAVVKRTSRTCTKPGSLVYEGKENQGVQEVHDHWIGDKTDDNKGKVSPSRADSQWEGER